MTKAELLVRPGGRGRYGVILSFLKRPLQSANGVTKDSAGKGIAIESQHRVGIRDFLRPRSRGGELVPKHNILCVLASVLCQGFSSVSSFCLVSLSVSCR